MGRLDGRGRLRYVARTVSLGMSRRQEVSRLLTAETGDHPWPCPLPATWIGQLDQRDPMPYVPVQPLLVAEIVVDRAYEHGRFRHPVRLLRLRPELHPDQLPRQSLDEFVT